MKNTQDAGSPGIPSLKRNGKFLLIAYGSFALVMLAVLSISFTWSLDTLAVGHSRVLRLVQLGLVTSLSFGFLLYLRQRAWAGSIPGLTGMAGAPFPMLKAGLAALALLGSAIVTLVVFQGVALSGDENAYLFQAGLFARGQLWSHPVPIHQYVAQPYIFPIGDKLVSQYPPGWPAVLALAESAGFPTALVNPVIGMLLVIALHRLALKLYGKEVALLAALIMTVSAFFLFNSASFFNGPVVALLGVLFVGSASSFIDRPSAGAAVGLAFWLSAIAVVRHFDAALFAAPVAAVLLWRCTARQWKFLPFAAAALPLLGLLLCYYWQVTGDPLVLPQKLHNANDGLLGPNWHPARATEILIGRLVELAEWVSPPFVAALAWSLLRKLRDGSLRFFDLYGPLFLVGYWFYWADGTLRWGPRYIYPAFPFMVLIVAECAWRALQAGRDRRGAAFAHLVLISVVVSTLQVPFLAARGRELIGQTQDVHRQVDDAGLHHAVVIVVSGTGTIWRVDVGDLVRNGPALDDDVVYAHGPGLEAGRITPADIDRTVQALRAYFPARDVWLYRRDRDSVPGTLTRA